MTAKNHASIARLFKNGLRLVPLITSLLMCQSRLTAATLNVSPSTVSNSYVGAITLQIGGLSAGDTVVVQKYFDVNGNGVVDSGDFMVQQFNLTDGQAGMLIVGVTNINVPGDTDGAANTQITTVLNFQNGDFMQNNAGTYLYVLSSPGGHFAAVTKTLTVTNPAYAQSFSGTVTNNGVAVPNAMVLMFGPPQPGQGGPGQPIAGVLADGSGHYSAQMPAGTYMLAPFRPGYLTDFGNLPVLTLNNSQNLQAGLALATASATVSGQLVDANNTNVGLPGILMTPQSASGLVGVGFTDTNGNFNLSVQAGQCSFKVDDTRLISHGYVGFQNNNLIVNASTNGVILTASKATALIWGRVTNNLGAPLPGLDVYASDNNSQYQADGYTDMNGNYVIGVLGFGSNDSWYVQPNGNNQLTNYVFSQETIDGNINAGQAERQDFTGFLGNNFITGHVQSGGTSIVGVGVSANLNGGDVSVYADTDTNGNYTMQVFNGSWDVNVNCGGGSDSLANILGGNYICPSDQTAIIANNNATNNFTVTTATNFITGYLRDNHGNPIPNVSIWANPTFGGYNNNPGATTDSSGHYSLGVPNDSAWDVGVNTGGGNSLPTQYFPPDSQQVGITNDSVEVDFVAILATNFISGYVRDANNNPLSNVWVYAYTINSTNNYNTGASTDNNGHYSFGVINSNFWGVGVYGNLPAGYLNPPDQDVPVTNDNFTAVNFYTILATNAITGSVRTSVGDNIMGVGVWASATINGESFTNSIDTDTNGDYSLSVGNGSWTVWLNCDGSYGGDSLDNILGINNYVCPAGQTVNVSNNNPTNNFVVEINCNVIAILDPFLPDGVVGVSYDQSLQAAGCFSPFTWSSLGGWPPAGLAWNTNNGEISGTPTAAGIYSASIKVTDSHGQSTNGTGSITIVHPLSITTTSLPGGVENAFYSQQLQATGGHPAYQWSWSSNQPPGLNLSTNGLLSGYPTSTGVFTFSVRAYDNYAYHSSYQDSTNQTLSLTISPQEFTINASAGANGGLAPSGTNIQVVAGGSQMFTATPNANYVVGQWLLDGTNVQSGGTTYTLVNVQTNHTLQVTFLFAAVQETIVASADTNGAISPSGTFNVSFGSNQVFTATPNTNYTVNQWLVDSNVVQSGGTNFTLVNVQSNHSVEVTFIEQFIINASTDGNGVINPSNSVTVPAGSNVVFTATPNANYAINQWLLDGTNVQTGGTNYSLTDVQANHNLEVTFSALAPAAIASLSAASAVGSVTLTWTGFADTSLKYKIYRAQTTNSLTNGGALATISLTNTSGQYVDGAGQPGLGYYYAVSAVNSNGAEGPYSTPAAGTNMVVWPQASTADMGGSLQLCVTAQSTTTLGYEWLLNGLKLSDGGLIAGSQAPCLIMGSVMSTGQLQVVISSSLGSVTSPPVLLNLSAPAIQFGTGTYNGLFYPNPPEEATVANSGAFALTMAKHGTFSGKLRLAASSESFTGTFDTNGFASPATPGKKGTALPMYLQLDTTPGQERITGVITNNGVICGIYAYLDPKNASTPTRYTLAMPPSGTNAAALPAGWSTFTASQSGSDNLSVAGTLADGTKVSQSAKPSPNGDFPLFVPLYHGKGLLMGWLVFTNDTAHGDSIIWIKPAGQANYASGFTLVTNVVGSVYQAPVTLNQGVLALQGAGVSVLLTNGVSVVNNKLTSATDNLSIKFTPSSGAFSGSFMPAAHQKVTLTGVVLQQQGEAVGCYLLNGESGGVTVEPAAP